MPIPNRCRQRYKTRQAASAKDYQQLAGISNDRRPAKKDGSVLYAAFCNAKTGWLLQDDGIRSSHFRSGDEEYRKAHPFSIRPRRKKQLSGYCVLSMITKRGCLSTSDLRSQIWPGSGRYRQLAEKPIRQPQGFLYAGVGKFTPPIMGGIKRSQELLEIVKQEIRQQCIRRDMIRTGE